MVAAAAAIVTGLLSGCSLVDDLREGTDRLQGGVGAHAALDELAGALREMHGIAEVDASLEGLAIPPTAIVTTSFDDAATTDDWLAAAALVQDAAYGPQLEAVTMTTQFQSASGDGLSTTIRPDALLPELVAGQLAQGLELQRLLDVPLELTLTTRGDSIERGFTALDLDPSVLHRLADDYDAVLAATRANLTTDWQLPGLTARELPPLDLIRLLATVGDHVPALSLEPDEQLPNLGYGMVWGGADDAHLWLQTPEAPEFGEGPDWSPLVAAVRAVADSHVPRVSITYGRARNGELLEARLWPAGPILCQGELEARVTPDDLAFAAAITGSGIAPDRFSPGGCVFPGA